MHVSGNIRKMQTSLTESNQPQYHLPIGDELIHMNEFIGSDITLAFSGKINCVACDRKIKKTFNQGYCFPCVQKLAQCDMCIVKPELCHYHEGTCREPQWGEMHCMKPHYVYLANVTQLKVGITRGTNIPSRWVDQGATEALPIFKVSTRRLSGLIEVICKTANIADKTNWRSMLKSSGESINLEAERAALMSKIQPEIDALKEKFPNEVIEVLDSVNVQQINFPVTSYLEKISSFNFDKTPEIKGFLQGIKGQYLIFSHGVLNIRKFAGYDIAFIDG